MLSSPSRNSLTRCPYAELGNVLSCDSRELSRRISYKWIQDSALEIDSLRNGSSDDNLLLKPRNCLPLKRWREVWQDIRASLLFAKNFHNLRYASVSLFLSRGLWKHFNRHESITMRIADVQNWIATDQTVGQDSTALQELLTKCA
jgi:hypothetical protein